jgi:hypothetical protein
MRTCSCASPTGELCQHQWEEVNREAAQRGSVVWQESATWSGGYYRWTLYRPDAEPVTGLADTEQDGWQRIREYVAAPLRHLRYRRRNPGPSLQ